MRTIRAWALRASPAAVFAASAAVVVICLAIAERVPVPPAYAGVLRLALSAALIAALSTWAVCLMVRRPVAAARALDEAMLRAVPAPLALVDHDGRVVEANAAAAALAGSEPDGRPLLQHCDPDLAAAFGERLREVWRTGSPGRFAIEAAGRRLNLSVVPLPGADRRFAVHLDDVTEAARLAAAAELAAEIDRRSAAGEDAAALMRHACARLLEVLALRQVWIAGKEPGGGVSVFACAAQGTDCEGEARRAGFRWDDTPAGRSPVGQALRGEAQAARLSATAVQDWQKAARRLGVQSLAAVPVKTGNTVLGALVMNSRRPDDFEQPGVLAVAGTAASRLAAALALVRERDRLRLFTTGLEAAANGVFITDRAGVIQWANAAFSRQCGWPVGEVLGRTPRFLKSGEQDATFYQTLWQTLLAGSVWTGDTIERRKDGTLYISRQTITPIRDFRGEISHFVAVHEDITRERETEERIRHMAQYDALTDLPNRALFFDRLGHGMAVARRNRGSLALLYLNLDHFRLINDTFGLRAGDAVLQGVASRLRDTTRDSDTIARLAGDEFAVILPQVLVREDAARVAQKIIEAMRPPFEVNGQELHVGVSIGIALFPQDGDAQEHLLSRADAALAVVKMQSRNSYKFASVA